MSNGKDQKTVLVLSKDASFLSHFRDQLYLRSFRILEAGSEQKALALFETEAVDVLFLDLACAGRSEIDFVHLAKTRSPSTEIVVVADIQHLEKATRALQNGAAFYLIRPLDAAHMKVVLNKLILKLERHEQYMALERRVLEELVAGNEGMRKVLNLALKVAPTSSTVLVEGDSGTGKEFFSRIIHRMSRRTDGPFVAINCGAIPEPLFESEMFGHKKGSFTGADRDKIGLAENANLGTLFLDEVGELSQASQVKLLRFLQERTVRRVGDTATRHVNVRVIAATNKSLSLAVKEGRFREDLFYRLNVFRLYLPPLRERRESIPYLIKGLMHKFNAAMEKNVSNMSRQAQVALAAYDYPGNIRELENIMEHAMTLADGNEIEAAHLPDFVFQAGPRLMAPDRPDGTSELLSLAEMEKEHILKVLQAVRNNLSEAAKLLGISRSTLWRKLKEYRIKDEELTADEPVQSAADESSEG